MLAKMGWSKGKGLGANENGAQDFIRVRYKNDIGGLGFSARDDQWTENEFTFNSLLKNLNGENSQKEGNGNEEESQIEAVNKIKSLEEKSKKSKSRVHYQKFTRGKDLSRYSEKDLANIFGKKSLHESYKIEKEDESSSGSTPEPVDYVEDSKMINTGVSITDYFKNKRQNLIKETESVNGNDTKFEEPLPESEEIPQKKRKSSKNKIKSDSNSDLDEKQVKVDEIETIDELGTLLDAPTKKKKSKKGKKIGGSKEMEVENKEESDLPMPKIKTKKEETPVSRETTVPLTEAKSKKRRLSNSDDVTQEENAKKQKNDAETTKITTITVGSDPNKFFLDAVAVEKLKYLRLEKFKDSNVANIVGYGLSKDIKLEVCDSSIVKGISHVNKYSIYANVDKMHSKKYYKSLLLRYHKKRNTFKM